MQNAREIKVGLTVLIALGLLYVSIAWTQRLHFFAPDESQYDIRFDNVNGLLEGDPVTIRGYTAGRVVSIFPSSTHVQVRITLDRNIPLYQDAMAEIQLKELMGGKQIAISPGAQKPEIGDGATLIGRISPDFSSSFSQFGDWSSQINANQLQQILQRIDSFSEFLMDISKQIDPELIQETLQHTADISLEVKSISQEVRSRQLIQRLDDSMQQLEQLLHQGEQLAGQSQQSLKRLDSLLLPSADSLLTDSRSTLQSLRTSLQQADILLSQLQSPDNLAGRVLNDPSLSHKVDSVIYHLNKTLEQIHSEKVIVGFGRKK